MLEITFQEPDLVQDIQTVAAREGIDATKFVVDAVRRQVAQYRQKQIAAETAVWYGLPSELRKACQGKFVAVHRGEIVGDDIDQMGLYFRMRERFGREPVLIIEGGDQPMPIYRVSSPRSV